MSRFWVAIFALALACGKPPIPPPPPPPVCPPGQIWNGEACVCPGGHEWVEGEGLCLPFRVDTPPNPKRIVGITAFALSLHDRTYIRSVCDHVKAHGYNTLRVGFELWRWDGVLGKSYLPKGPRFDSKENLENIRRMLDETARVPGIWVELIPVFTIKGLNGYPDTSQMRRRAVNLAIEIVTKGDYKHVFFSYANEWGRSRKISESEVIWGLQELRKTGRLVTTDSGGEFNENGRRWDPKYPKEFLPYVDMVAFHPRRNPDPTEWDLGLGVSRYVVRRKKLACLYNETVSYASDADLNRFPWLRNNFRIANNGKGSEAKRKQIIVDYMNRVRKVGGKWYYHCIKCFMGDEEFEGFWIPQWAN